MAQLLSIAGIDLHDMVPHVGGVEHLFDLVLQAGLLDVQVNEHRALPRQDEKRGQGRRASLTGRRAIDALQPELEQLIVSKPTNLARAVGHSIERAIMKQVQHAVLAPANVDLHAVGAVVHSRRVRFQGVLRG